MRLLSATLRRIRRHRELSLRFDPGVTLIGGPNEAGKSTLLEALHKGLFLRASATGRGVEELRSRLHPGQPEVEIAFEAAGRRWQLRKRFSGASGTCQLSDDAGEALSGDAAEERLAGLLGFAASVEGRRISQLSERWAHLWVRQGESGVNLFSGSGESYDLERLVEQLQTLDCGRAMESPLDRRVVGQLRQRMDAWFTGTGRVRAGSSLALVRQRQEEAQRHLEQARLRQAELERAMEELEGIGRRLAVIEGLQRPRLQVCRQLEGERRLIAAEVDRLRERRASLRNDLRQLQDLEGQRQAAEREQGLRREGLTRLEAEAEALQRRQLLAERERRELEERRRDCSRRIDRLRLQLDLEQLAREEEQLNGQRQRFGQLRQRAEALKEALRSLPAIGTAEVASLRRLEQELAQAEIRCQAMATSVQLLAADCPVRLGETPLTPGDTLRLEQETDLRVGEGVRLRLSPGGGRALAEAGRQLLHCRERLEQRQGALGVTDSQAAEGIAIQRQQRESELAHLRREAATIPWARLEAQATALTERRQRLRATLERQGDPDGGSGPRAGEPPAGGGLSTEIGLERLRHELEGIEQRLEQVAGILQTLRSEGEQLRQRLEGERRRLGQLSGSLEVLVERRRDLAARHGDEQALLTARAALEEELQGRQALLSGLDQRIRRALEDCGPPDSPGLSVEEWLNRLEAEKDELLTARGQNEERCLQLGAADPSAEVERALAASDSCREERRSLEQEVEAVKLLVSLFGDARRDLARRYSEPLRRTIALYLADVAGHEPSLDFDPRGGFGDLRLRQDDQTYRYEQLSGGMQEQLTAAVRLAMADVLRGAYDDVLPLVFDDAFTAADPGRLQGVQRMLRRGAVRGIQIILLSCTPENYEALLREGGSRIDLRQAVPEALRG